MAFTLTLSSGGVLIIPDSAVNINVANNPSGIATSGVVTIVGEADEGPSWSQDVSDGNKLSSNSYGPGDIGRVTGKYGSGNLVDAFRGILSPSASPRITGGPNRVIIVKTNSSSKASRTTSDAHGTFTAKRGGEAGNFIQEAIATSQSESAPTSGSFSYVPSASSSSAAFRVNGGSKQTLSISANETPTALAGAITGLSSLNAVGGINRSVLSGLSGQNIEVAASGQNVNIKLALGQVFTTAPQVGDTARIPSGSVIQGGSNENIGWYLVTAVSNTTSLAQISAKKITAGAPATVAPTAISGTPDNDLIDYSFMRIDNMSGSNRNILTGIVGQSITVTVVSSSLTATLASGQVFASTPRVGDIVYIPSGSAYQGAGNANIGWYQVTLVSNNTSSAFITMSRLSNGSPVAVGSTPIAAVSDIQDYDKQIKGIGKTLEVEDNTGTVNINTIIKDLGVDDPADFLQSTLVSSAELQKTITITRNSSNTQETFSAGGSIALKIGYLGTTASCTISLLSGILTFQTTVSGGLGSNLSIDLSKVPTISDLVAKINEHAGYTASIGSTAEGQRNPSVLDRTTFTFASDLSGSQPGRLKHDIWDLTTSNSGVSKASGLVSYTASATAGLPEDNSAAFLSGGTKGATTGLQFSQAIDALQATRCNFVVPLVSQDASEDISEGATDPSSTYTVDSINAAVKSHCLAMSTAKIKRHRIGVVSKRGTFNEAKQAAQTMATFRIAMLFQDITDLNSNGELEQFQPWMGSVKAAGMQAAGVYKGIFNKEVNISGTTQAAGDFDDENLSQVEDALLAGLIPVQRQETGGFTFVSDQMTYSLDNNFVYNSMQAVYVADLMALSLAQSLKIAFVGESVADVTEGAVLSFVKAKMAEFLGLKFTVGTTQFPGGWKSIGINISAGVLEVNVVAIEATTIKFIPINLNIEGIQTSAAA